MIRIISDWLVVPTLNYGGYTLTPIYYIKIYLSLSENKKIYKYY